MNNLNFNGLLMTAAALLGTSFVLEIPDKIRDLQAEIARLRECVRAGDELLENYVPMIDNDDAYGHGLQQAYARAREAVG